MLNLHRGSCDMFLTGGRLFRRGGASRKAAGASVVAHVVCDVIDDDSLGVDVGHVRDVVHGAVVEEPSVVPISALIAHTGVAEAVVYAAVESDLGAPVALVKNERVIAPAPVARGPEKTRLWRHYPRT